MNEHSTLQRLLNLLSDGEWHSGQDLGDALSISRAAISKQIKHVLELGIELEVVKGVGYRAEPFELLSPNRISDELARRSEHLSALNIFYSIPSTNQYLMDALREGEGVHGVACFAEAQTQGRGRRGREWVSPFAKNLYMSFGWAFDGGVAQIEGLSLAVGVVVCEVLEELGFASAKLKWPNDILVGEKKLGGVLIELGGDTVSDCMVVVGVGLNVNMSIKGSEAIDQPWTSLKLEGKQVGRNLLAARLSSALLAMLKSYSASRFSGYREQWNARAAYVDEVVSVSSTKESTQGVMRGVGEQGELLLEIGGELRAFHGGELSLRKRT